MSRDLVTSGREVNIPDEPRFGAGYDSALQINLNSSSEPLAGYAEKHGGR